jgi:hypothetical protein
MRSILLAALLAAGPAFAADYVATNGKDYVRLQSGSCPEDILAMVPIDARDQFFAARANLNGKDYRACWTLVNGAVVYLRYEDADEGEVPLIQFKPVQGI